MSEHTPGPWRVDRYTNWIVTDGDPYGHGWMHVADARGWGHLTGTGAGYMAEEDATSIQDANARLIAAAPELLDMCEGVLTLLQYLSIDDKERLMNTLASRHGSYVEVGQTIEQLKVLIAKATKGEEANVT